MPRDFYRGIDKMKPFIYLPTHLGMKFPLVLFQPESVQLIEELPRSSNPVWQVMPQTLPTLLGAAEQVGGSHFPFESSTKTSQTVIYMYIYSLITSSLKCSNSLLNQNHIFLHKFHETQNYKKYILHRRSTTEIVLPFEDK